MIDQNKKYFIGAFPWGYVFVKKLVIFTHLLQ